MRRRTGRRGRLKRGDWNEIWERVRAGESYRSIGTTVGCSPRTIERAVLDRGGILPRRPAPRRPGPRPRLRPAEREEISRGLRAGESYRSIAGRIGRPPSTVWREVTRNGGRAAYRAWHAAAAAHERARRPRAAKLALNAGLRDEVERLLRLRWSPEQIAARLRIAHPDARELRVSHETIYQSLYVQGRGALRRELAACLRTGRAWRKVPGPRGQGTIRDLVRISERPAEIEDRAVPGHWEGDLLMGRAQRSAVATLVERQTRYVLLAALPGGRTAPAVADALAARIRTLPAHLRRSLTWDRGHEMAAHAAFTVATGVAVYFCDPSSPWQRGSNENTNGLLRQYLPRTADFSTVTQDELDAIAAELNGRPRKTLGWMTPSERFAELVASTG